MPMRQATLSIRPLFRAAAWTLVLAFAIPVLTACNRDGSDRSAAPASTAAPMPDTPAAAADALASPRTQAQAAPAPVPEPSPGAAAGRVAAPPPSRADVLALADATAAAEPVRDGVARKPVDKPEVAASSRVDDRCATAADCAVKDVGSCCGYRPQCVNRDGTTFPEAAKADCASKGRVGICGFPAIDGCECVQGHCAAVLHAENVLVQ